VPKIKVLVADNDHVNLALLHRELTQWGYHVVLAEDGEHAQHLAWSESFHICILAWLMPRMSGLELCSWIKANMAPAPHVMLLTSQLTPEVMHAGYAAGADDYVSKPFNGDDLRSRLAKLARNATCHDATPQSIAHMNLVDLYRQDLDLYTHP
jgi:DNA-binding response OmpR family regulator